MHHYKKKYDCGFTLTELLITLVLLGILYALAYPSYLNFIHKSRRTDALDALIQTQILMEQCYSQHLAYNAPCTTLPPFPQSSPKNFYTINSSNVNASTYTLTARPKGSQEKDSACALFVITQNNIKTAFDLSGVNKNGCWNL